MKQASGIGLILLGLLMAVGFTQAQMNQSALVIFMTFCITVGLPLGGGAYLLWSARSQKKTLGASKSQLAAKTLQAEILRLAAEHHGHLTVLDVTQAFALDSEQAEAALDALTLKHLAEVQLTDDGLLVYAFPEVQQMGSKYQAKRLEEF